MVTGKATIVNVTGRCFIMAIYALGVATRTVNGDGCHGELSLKSTHHTISTDRRHYQVVQQRLFKPSRSGFNKDLKKQSPSQGGFGVKSLVSGQ